MARIRLAHVVTAGVLAMAFAAGVAHGQNNTPFSSTYRRPTVSPYTMLTPGAGGMNLGNVSMNGAVQTTFNPLVYQQLIQPREEQEQGKVTQMQQGRQINSLQNRVQQIQRDTTARQVNEQIRPTGHGATYLYMSHYYPGGR